MDNSSNHSRKNPRRKVYSMKTGFLLLFFLIITGRSLQAQWQKHLPILKFSPGRLLSASLVGGIEIPVFPWLSLTVQGERNFLGSYIPQGGSLNHFFLGYLIQKKTGYTYYAGLRIYPFADKFTKGDSTIVRFFFDFQYRKKFADFGEVSVYYFDNDEFSKTIFPIVSAYGGRILFGTRFDISPFSVEISAGLGMSRKTVDERQIGGHDADDPFPGGISEDYWNFLNRYPAVARNTFQFYTSSALGLNFAALFKAGKK